MSLSGRLRAVALIACVLAPLAFAPLALALPETRAPYIGYVFPAGGRQGTTFDVKLGGQFLRAPRNVYVTGDGISATIVGYWGPNGPLNRQQQKALRARIWQILRQRFPNRKGRKPAKQADTTPPVTIPNLPDLQNLDKQNVRQLHQLMEKYCNPDKRTKPPIAETVFLRITIDGAATPGDREIRLLVGGGLTNPLLFEVGQLPETTDAASAIAATAQAPPAPLTLPVTLNGQIMPGEVDRYRISAHKGQHLVARMEARRLIPYLADAVPGWFQGVLSLRDAAGKEVAYDDDYRFDPDPVLFYDVPADGVYTLEVRDAIYRGRADFVYRCSVGELPFITSMFPLGGHVGVPTTVGVTGWNLPFDKVILKTDPGGPALRRSSWLCKLENSNSMPYAVDDLPELVEAEPNDTIQQAQKVSLPTIVNGRISKPGDVDVFAIDGRAGEQVVAEVQGRRLASPIDSLLRLTNASGKVLAWNDDTPDPSMGLITNFADSYIFFKLPAAGTYYIEMSDAEHHGGEEYTYRLRLSQPRPDFTVIVTPSTINTGNGHPAVMTAYAFRRDGFDGAIDLSVQGGLSGFTLSGATIPAGVDKIRLTLTPPLQRLDGPVGLEMEATARIAGRTVEHQVVPADRMMQAFIYEQLVHRRIFACDVMGMGRAAGVATVEGAPISVPSGGSAPVRVSVPALPAGLQNVGLDIDSPPDGVSVSNVAADKGAVTFTLNAKAGAPKVGYADNLILEIYTANAQGKRMSLGTLPAVAFRIVKP